MTFGAVGGRGPSTRTVSLVADTAVWAETTIGRTPSTAIASIAMKMNERVDGGRPVGMGDFMMVPSGSLAAR